MAEPPPPPMRANVYLSAQPPSAEDWRAWVTSHLAHYPSIGAWRLQQDQAKPFEQLNFGRSRVAIEWSNPQPGRRPTDEERKEFFDKIAPEYSYRTDRYMRPSVEGVGKQPPAPIMTWWLLLYSFSMLARYQPRKWVDLLDFDRSPHATNLQFIMDRALTSIPHLVLGALDGKVPLLNKPMTFV
jgi:hypothetical protein